MSDFYCGFVVFCARFCDNHDLESIVEGYQAATSGFDDDVDVSFLSLFGVARLVLRVVSCCQYGEDVSAGVMSLRDVLASHGVQLTPAGVFSLIVHNMD